jgi:hypothetical protein
MWVALVWLSVLIFRYGLMENRWVDFDAACDGRVGLWYCELKEVIGISIAWKLWGVASAVLLLVATLCRSTVLTFISLLIALAGLILYQNYPSAPVFVLALMSLGYRLK